MGYVETRRHVASMLPKGGIGAEIGVWKGDFSHVLLDVSQPRCLHLIDPWQASAAPEHKAAWYSKANGTDMDAVFAGVQSRFADRIAAGSVRLHRAPSVQALGTLPDGALDYVYVDGDHSYKSVRADLEISLSKVRRGGAICVDDHRLGKWWGDGVVRAVNEFLGTHPEKLMLVFSADTQVLIAKR